MSWKQSLVVAVFLACSLHATLHAQSRGPKPALPTTSGPLVYTYCFFGQNTKTYVSAVFEVHGQESGMSTPQYRRILSDAYDTPFRKYLDAQYNVPTDLPSSHGCHDGFATRALAESNRVEYVGLSNKFPSKGLTAIETPWQGTGPDALPLKAQEDAPDQASRDLNRLIEREVPTLEPACQHNGMSHLMDCSCVAETIHAARVAGPTKVDGGHLIPQFEVLKTSLNFGACTSPERLTKYATDRVDSTYRNPDMRVPLESCVPRKMVAQIMANPATLTHTEGIDRFFLADVNACRAGH